MAPESARAVVECGAGGGRWQRRFLVASACTQSRAPSCPACPLQGHVYKKAEEIINDKAINEALEKTKANAKDPVAIKAILEAAKERSFLTNFTPGIFVVG